MKKISTPAVLLAVAIAASGCGAISDAPEAGSERFLPISNNAYLVRQGPMLDRYWIDGPPRVSPAPRATPRAPQQRLYK